MDKKVISLTALLFTAVIILLSGCASSLMMKVPPMDAPDTRHAVVTFMRPSFFGGAIQFGIWDSENFVGILSAGSYVQYLAEPGEHLFLARAENWSYVKADLQGGKKYFILGKVFPGVWKARVAFDPITKDDGTTQAQIDEWIAELKPTAVIPEKFDNYVKPRTSHVKKAVGDFKSGNVKYEVLEADDNR
ncbi:MAG: hypothetical protein JRJ86_23390 [Deltaproteobacteria bacterium]|nr:hypothetical protein [Deltaproteobacteria bacterium]MBW2117459.1 hypothetical protein [Deltaproteobacteria bacterium]MBW2345958.1 hypothetical protein [Deltaproteobacteria bacterium]